MDFYPPPHCGGHREPKFYTGYPENNVNTRCVKSTLCTNDQKSHIFQQKWSKI